jgi:hypothetical protein
MARTKTTWAKGKSGNPKGRPAKGRALTEILERAAAETIEVPGQKKRRARQQLVAEHVWTALATGKITFPDGDTLQIQTVEEFMHLAKFVYTHIDGPPKLNVDFTSNGETIGPAVFLPDVLDINDADDAE